MGSNICCSFSKAEESKLESLNNNLSSRRIKQGSNRKDSDEVVMKDFVIPIENDENSKVNLLNSEENLNEIFTVEKRFSLKKAIVKGRFERKLLITAFKADFVSVKHFFEFLDKCKELDCRYFCVPQEIWEDEKNIFIVSDVPAGHNFFESFVSKKKFSEAEVVKYLKYLIPVLGSDKHFQCFNPEDTYLGGNEEFEVKIVPHALPRAFFNSPDTKNLYFDSKSQSWTLGILIYILLCGKSPFKTDPEHHETKPVFNFANKHWDSISSQAKNLIMKLLSINPEKRPSLSDILKDPWLIKPQNPKNNHKVEKDFKEFCKKLLINSAKNELKHFFSVQRNMYEEGVCRIREIEFSATGSKIEDNGEVKKSEKKNVLGLLLENYLKEFGDCENLNPHLANELLSELGYFADTEVIEGEISLQELTELILNLLET